MSFTTRTLDELHDLILAHLRGRSPEMNLAKGSDEWMRARAVAAVYFGLQQPIVDMVREILPTTASPAFLPDHARARMGADAGLLPAAAAKGKILATSAAAGEALTAGLTLSHPSGRKYKVSTGVSTSTPGFAGKTVLFGSTTSRVLVSPNATGITADMVVSIGGVTRAVRDVLPEIGTTFALDLYQALTTQPTIGDTIVPVTGAVVSIEAVDAGAAGNLLPGDALTWDSPPGTTVAQATVLELTGGGDVETPEQLRQRILAWAGERPGSGNRADYRDWARRTPGVRIEDACVFVGYRGIGTIDVVPIGVSGARATGTTTNATILAYLQAQASRFDDVRVRQLADDVTQDVTLQITAAPGFEPDWTGSYTVNAGSTTTAVVLTATPTVIDVGMRVLVYVGSGVRPGLYEVTVIGKSGSTLTVSPELPAAPTAGALVDPGGPLTADIIAAIGTLFDNLGPSDDGGYERYPDPGVAWEYALRPERISAAVLAANEGVEGCTVVAPVGVVTAAEFARVALGVLRITHV